MDNSKACDNEVSIANMLRGVAVRLIRQIAPNDRDAFRERNYQITDYSHRLFIVLTAVAGTSHIIWWTIFQAGFYIKL
jgi:hypothetical protein